MSKIAFFSEGTYTGRLDKFHSNPRTDIAWQVMLDSFHYPISHFKESLQLNQKWDYWFLIIPKNSPGSVKDLIENVPKNTKLVIIQEGPRWYWEDYPIEDQAVYFNSLKHADMILAHNSRDVHYFKALLGDDKLVETIQTLQLDIFDQLSLIGKDDRMGVIIGGNFTHWYGGAVSYKIAQRVFPNKIIHAPSMGRKPEGEEKVKNLHHLGYMPWRQWIEALSTFRYAIHMMPSALAGTFSMNCASLGIPCIGYSELNTQRILFPELAVETETEAVKLLTKLKEDEDYYDLISSLAQSRFKEHYSEKQFSISIKTSLNKIK